MELAINSLVTEFHKAAADQPTMNTTQFQTMISKQLPSCAKMGVQGGDNISFQNFWTLINKQAVDLFQSSEKNKSYTCTCLLQ
ncbi:hypothetical protein F7725_017777 [Dissostichus mawsoni]|uniref:S100/CaBP-9k-type calcium binding subdomain domain-containing protein n=1 Tax=Dissostichus mawsoni TaxID=36200 RepID=A0A7J5XPW0_DISMA|nr:hypothetical protein F7725_017777 [Dissostichus mawsoni]